MANNTKNISRLLNPKSIAVIGGREAAEVIRQCRKLGYEGDIWPVNVKRETIKGLTCYQTLSELPSAPDASFIAIPADATVEIVKQLNDLKPVAQYVTRRGLPKQESRALSVNGDHSSGWRFSHHGA
ncbi:MAG: CoA-binding protein [Arenicellales bacterium WSBS_2016_MAG_OTU3]